MATVRDHADKGAVALISHIKHKGAESMTYSEFAEMIRWFRKDGRPNGRVNRVLEAIGNDLRKFDEKAPRITVLVTNKNTGKVSSGFGYFKPDWNKMSDSEKKGYIDEEKKKIEQWRRSGKFDEFLWSLKNKTNTSIEFPSEETDNVRTVADGVTVQKHCAFEYKVRNQTIVKTKKEKSGYICECCGFNFRETYGMLGEFYIECHHIKPLANSKSGEQIGPKDLAALCANCHRMIHKLLADKKETYKNNYPQSIKNLRGMVGTLRRRRQYKPV